jgi:arylsulfatase
MWVRGRRGARAETVGVRPDLVLFMTDQQRFDQTGYASGGHFETPVLDALAASGTTFDLAHSASTTCVPARASLLTGVAAHRLPVQADGYTLREGYWNVAYALARAGYETALIGKMHFNPMNGRHGFETMRTCEHLFPGDFTPQRILCSGFDDYHQMLVDHGLADWRQHLDDEREPGQPRRPYFPYDEHFHPTEWVADEAIALLERRDRTRPLFLVVSFPHPHEPHNPPERYGRLFDPADSIIPAEGFETNDGLPPGFQEAFAADDGPWQASRVRSEEHLRDSLAIVRGLVRHIDDAMGRVLTSIDADRSVVMFTSDHGDYAGHRGLMRKLPWIPFDDLARVPLVVRAPDGPPGLRSADLVSSSDLVLTCLDYAGVEVDAEVFDSQSLRPLVTGATPGVGDGDRALLMSPNSGWPSVRRGSLKLITRRHWVHPGRALFDLDADPGETVNLVDDPRYAEELDELQAWLDAELARPLADLPFVETLQWMPAPITAG